MNKDNVVKFPQALDRLAAGIKADLERAEMGRQSWVDGMVSAAQQIAEARAEFKDNIAFGEWWDAQSFGLNHQDRAALIKMGAQPETMREVLTATKRRSPQHIFAESIGRFTQVSKTPHRHTATRVQRRLDPDRDRPQEAKAREAVRAAKDAGLAVNPRDIGDRLGISHVIVEQAAAMERAVEEDRRESQPIDFDTLPLTSKKKLEVLTKRLEQQQQRQLAAWRATLDEEVRQRVLTNTAEQLKKLGEREAEAYAEYKRYNDLINNHKPIYSLEEWEVLRRVTHPDNSASEATRARAFGLVNDKKLQLTGKK